MNYLARLLHNNQQTPIQKLSETANL